MDALYMYIHIYNTCPPKSAPLDIDNLFYVVLTLFHWLQNCILLSSLINIRFKVNLAKALYCRLPL